VLTRDASFSAPPRAALLLTLVAVAAAFPFISALGGPFIWDDTHLIENNPHVHSFAHPGRFFTHSFFDTGTGASASFLVYFRPLLHLSYALDWAIGKGNPAIFHATNLLLAMIAAGLVADSLMRWTRITHWALLCALVFAWHPTKAESVAWISGRTDLLVTIFMLLACKAHSKRAGVRAASRLVELLATFCAYASKETAVLLPLFIAIEHWSNAGHPPLGKRFFGSLFKALSPQLLVAFAYLALRSQLFPIVTLKHASVDQQLLATRLGLVLETLGRAAQLLIFPFPQAAEHGLAAFDNHSQLILSPTHEVLGGAFLLALTALALLTRRRAPVVAIGSATILVSLLPTANLIPTHLQCAIYERFLFLPTLGLALLLTGLLPILARTRTVYQLSLVALVCILALYCLQGTARAEDYASTERFWTHEKQVNPLSTVARQGLVDSARSTGNINGAVRALIECHDAAITRRQHRIAVRCAFDGAVLVADTTPDLNTAGLAAAGRFFQAFAQRGSHSVAELLLPELSVAIDTSKSPTSDVVRELSGESFAMLGLIEARLNEPQAAEHARSALRSCSTCGYSLRVARVLATTDHVEEALRVLARLEAEGPQQSVTDIHAQIIAYAYWKAQSSKLQGPQRIHAAAQADLVLGFYGAAYQLLTPHTPEFADSPAMNLQYAQIALFAGNEHAARNSLAALMQPAAISGVLDSWSKRKFGSHAQ
jgi:hypothetical protein